MLLNMLKVIPEKKQMGKNRCFVVVFDDVCNLFTSKNIFVDSDSSVT